MTTEVSITLEGESSVPDSNVLQVLDSVEVESLPTEIPETIIVDLSQLTEIGQAISIQDIIKSSGFTIVCEEDQLENPVVLLQEMRAEEEEVEPTETEIIGKGKSEEGRMNLLQTLVLSQMIRILQSQNNVKQKSKNLYFECFLVQF